MSGRIAGAVVALAVGSSTLLSLLLGLGLVAFTIGVTLGHLVSAARRSGGISGMS